MSSPPPLHVTSYFPGAFSYTESVNLQYNIMNTSYWVAFTWTCLFHINPRSRLRLGCCTKFRCAFCLVVVLKVLQWTDEYTTWVALNICMKQCLETKIIRRIVLWCGSIGDVKRCGQLVLGQSYHECKMERSLIDFFNAFGRFQSYSERIWSASMPSGRLWQRTY
jgi:hypothetical protein